MENVDIRYSEAMNAMAATRSVPVTFNTESR